MINRFSRLLANKSLLPSSTYRLFSSDWNRDREKAAEKEYMMRQEKKNLGKLSQKQQSESKSAMFDDLSSSDEEKMEAKLRDREAVSVC